VDASDVEVRVLGCLVEKQRTTPDAYPLSLNGLRLACNQATNRDPVVAYDEVTIRDALAALSRKGWARLASGRGSRVVKYRHLLDEALGLSDGELGVLAVLMLRGPQTPGELKQRTERLHAFTSLGEVEEVLERLVERELVRRLERRPGQKETRYEQLLGGDEVPRPSAVGDEEPAAVDRLSSLEERLARVEEQLAGLLDSLGVSPTPDTFTVHPDDVAPVGDDDVVPAAAPDDVERSVH
jgi:uncharacterized protein